MQHTLSKTLKMTGFCWHAIYEAENASSEKPYA